MAAAFRRTRAREHGRMAKMQYNLTVPDPEKFASALQAAKTAGMTVIEAAAELGVMIGTIDSADLAKINRIDGIGAIEPGREVSID